MIIILTLFFTIFFICRKRKKNKHNIAGHIAQQKAQEQSEENRRSTKRREWALALADVLMARNKLKTQGVKLNIRINDQKRQQLAAQLLKELGIEKPLSEDALREQVRHILNRWPTGIGKAPQDFYSHLAAEGKVRDALAFDCMRTAFLTRCIALLGWCGEEQAWRVLLLNAQRAQDCFSSWEDYASAYVRARQVWLTLQGTPSTVIGRDSLEVTSYLNSPLSNWRKLPWNAFKIFSPD